MDYSYWLDTYWRSKWGPTSRRGLPVTWRVNRIGRSRDGAPALTLHRVEVDSASELRIHPEVLVQDYVQVVER